MLAPRQHLILTGIAVLAAILALTNIALFKSNQTVSAEYAQRGQFVQQSAQLEPLYQQIIKALAELAIKNNDTKLRDLLGSQGITITNNPSAAAVAPAK